MANSQSKKSAVTKSKAGRPKGKKSKGRKTGSKVPAKVKITKAVHQGDILRNLERIARVMRSSQHSHGLNPAQWEALRYIASCNRYSDSPTALTGFLAATKGTVSQTIKALQKKGLIVKTPRSDERRSIMLSVSAAGRDMLKNDPLQGIAESIAGLGKKTTTRFSASLAQILQTELALSGNRIIGVCKACRYFREAGGPHQCLLFNAPLSTEESGQICVEYQSA